MNKIKIALVLVLILNLSLINCSSDDATESSGSDVTDTIEKSDGATGSCTITLGVETDTPMQLCFSGNSLDAVYQSAIENQVCPSLDTDADDSIYSADTDCNITNVAATCVYGEGTADANGDFPIDYTYYYEEGFDDTIMTTFQNLCETVNEGTWTLTTVEE